MEVRKYHYSVFAFFIICLVFLFGFNTCFAGGVTPINQMTPEIANEIFKFFSDNESFSFYTFGDTSTYSSFYSQLNNTNLQSFVDKWNNLNFSNKADYLENCVFVAYHDSTYGSKNKILVFFNNSSVGSISNHLNLQKDSNIKYYLYNVNDNGSVVSFYYLIFELNSNGTTSSITLNNLSTDGFLLTLSKSTAFDVSSSSDTFSSLIMTSYNIFSLFRTNISGSWEWRFNTSSVNLPEPEPSPSLPSGDVSGTTGTITNNSGETTGSINLSGIEQGLTSIQNSISGESQRIIDTQNQNTQTIVNTISGETQKITNTLTDNADETIENTVITSGDIESSLGFEIAENPYSNFWTTLTNNLSTALLGSKRSIDISFQGRTWPISLDEYLVLPTWLTIILIPISTAFFTWYLVRQWKIIFNKLASGNIDSLLKENSQEGISNLF